MIVDGHNDVLLEHVERPGSSPDLVLRRGRERLLDGYWLPRLEAAGVGLQICPLYGATAPHGEARAWGVAQEVEFRLAVEENPDRVRHVRTSADLDDSRFRLLLSMEGLEPLEGDPDAFEEWYGLGVRSASLTWNYGNEFAGGVAAPEQGLSDRGRALVCRFAELGVMLDLAHASEQTWHDVLAEEVPFSVTHACCRAVHDNRRNLADWQLEALAERGGVLGVMALRFTVDPHAPTISRLVDHVDHAVAVMGVEHVGLGADFIKLETPEAESPWIDGFAEPSAYPALVTGLRERGYDGERLDAILSENWLRTLRETLSRGEPMLSGHDLNDGRGVANPGPFVVSYRCASCRGDGCSACRGTGVARYFHGTKAELSTGDLIEPGHRANFGRLDRSATYIHLTGTLDAATWGAELALGEGRGRIYIVEPVGSIEDDPNLTDKKFPGNPTKSYRSREPLRVIGEVVDWQRHSPDELKAMREGLERLRQQRVEPID